MSIEAEQLEREIVPVVAEVGSLAVVDAATYALGGELLRKVKAAQKRIKDFWAPIKSAANAAWKKTTQGEANMLEELNVVEARLKSSMTMWQDEQERMRLAEQRRLQANADEAARKERERLEKQAAKLKSPELREERMAQAATIVAPVVRVETEKPKVAGVSTHKDWKLKSVDLKALVAAAARDDKLLVYLQANEAVIRRVVKATNGSLIPGVVAEEVTIMAARGEY